MITNDLVTTIKYFIKNLSTSKLVTTIIKTI